jgi:hypothetical protein
MKIRYLAPSLLLAVVLWVFFEEGVAEVRTLDVRNHAGAIVTGVALDSNSVDTLWVLWQSTGTKDPYENNYGGAFTLSVRVDSGAGVTYANSRDSLGMTWHTLQHDKSLGDAIPHNEANIANYLFPSGPDTIEVTPWEYNWGTGGGITAHSDLRYSASKKLNPRASDGGALIIRNGPGASACSLWVIPKLGATGAIQ